MPVFYVIYILDTVLEYTEYIFKNWHSPAALIEVFPCFFSPSVVRQMPGYNSQGRGTVRTLPN